jgi:hypothetical protein
MLSDPIDLRIFLSDSQFRQRVLRSKAWEGYLALLPIPPFDEPGTIAEIERRNALRGTHHLPLLDVEQEVARLKEHYESPSRADRFYTLASECIREIYGPLEPKDFNSLSAMRGLFASKQCVIRNLLNEQAIPQPLFNNPLDLLCTAT